MVLFFLVVVMVVVLVPAMVMLFMAVTVVIMMVLFVVSMALTFVVCMMKFFHIWCVFLMQRYWKVSATGLQMSQVLWHSNKIAIFVIL